MLPRLPFPQPRLGIATDPTTQDCDVLIVGITTASQVSGSFKRIDEVGGGWISKLLDAGKVSGKEGEMTLIASPNKVSAAMVLLVGLGDQDQLALVEVARDKMFRASAAAIRKLIDKDQERIVVALPECCDRSVHDVVVSGVLFALEGEAIYRSEPVIKVPAAIDFVGIDQAAIDRGVAIGESMNQTRRLVNEPPSVIYPESFAARAVELGESVGLDVEVWDKERLEKENCRAMLAVGAASPKSPRLVILRHNGGGDEAPLALVGKGVTFDSGGLSLKPSEGMKAMKCDMAGAATVVGVMHAIAKLGIKRNVIGYCGLAENMVSGDSYKLGDVIKTRNGKTIEILNTDAEGRVVLADTLDVAIESKPAAMVDLATLTGACLVALGKEVAGLMTNDQTVCDAVAAAANAEGEPVWQLPMFELYDEKIKSKVADIRNIGDARWGGAITAAKFLENFVGDTPWVHIDIAGPAFADAPLAHRDAGATGALVRSLVRWIETVS
ncbi:leucyl aminopeptidase [Planctomycetes bacterium K23_9]|uniref:Probable cytosol aminopeptidase n=1 Tax=Stieleria marina TaxID=1930275 RepID=A0A517P2Y2_9BACT|nr:Cytosol aminopeptidase [Planctomycetes bacterium K23_9]